MTTWLIWILIVVVALVGLAAAFGVVLVLWHSRSTTFVPAGDVLTRPSTTEE